MTSQQFEQLMTVLTEIRDDNRALLVLAITPLDAAAAAPPAQDVHVHTPGPGTPIAATFWVCQCGWVYDSETTEP